MSSIVNEYTIFRICSLTNDFPLLIRSSTSALLAVDYDTHQFSFEANQGVCVFGQLLSLEGALYIQGKEHEFYATGKIIQIVSLMESTAKFVVELHRHDANLWSLFQQSIQIEQRKTDVLFSSMRDYE